MGQLNMTIPTASHKRPRLPGPICLGYHTEGLNEAFMISFLAGRLKEDIRLGVQMFQPISLTAAIGLARLQEEKLAAKCHQVGIDATQATPFVGTGVGKTSNRPIKKLTPMEMQARRGKG